MATFCTAGGATLPTMDLAGKPGMFDSINMLPYWIGQIADFAHLERFYYTENELFPRAVHIGPVKFVFNLRGNGGQETGGYSVDSNLGWKGPEK